MEAVGRRRVRVQLLCKRLLRTYGQGVMDGTHIAWLKEDTNV